MVFDHLRVTDVSLRINGHQEPSEDINISYDGSEIARAYHRLMTFMGRDQNIDTGLQISQTDFASLYPIYYFSLKHMDLTKQSVVDIHFKATVTDYPAANADETGPPPVLAGVAGFRAIAVILSDKAMLLEGVGGRMRVVIAPVENM